MDSENPLIQGNSRRSINDLPDEVLEYIISLTSSYKDLEECKLVCKRWHRSVLSVIRFKIYNLYRAIAENNVKWQHIRPLDMAPTITKRYSHSACCYGNSMYVFGGCTSTSTTFNDLWRLDLTRRQWVRPLSMGSYPSPKACASLVIHRDNLVLFGGWTHPSPYPLHQAWRLFNELHLYSMESNRWVIHTTPSNSPPPTAGHSASVHRDCMVIFGGLQMQGGHGQYANSNDVWVFDLENSSWHKQVVSPGPKPYARYGQSQISLDEDHLLIIGGCGGPNMVFSDVWLLTMSGPLWSWKELKVKHPERAAAHMWCHPACKVGQNVVVLSRNPAVPLPSSPATAARSPEVRIGSGASQMLRLQTSNIWVPPRAEEAMEEEESVPNNQRNDRNVQPERGNSLRKELRNQNSGNANAGSGSLSPQPSTSGTAQLSASNPPAVPSTQSSLRESLPSTSSGSPVSSSIALSSPASVSRPGPSSSPAPVHRALCSIDRSPFSPALRLPSEERGAMSQPMAAFRTAPSPSAQQGRHRQRLESLRRMEERISSLSRRASLPNDEAPKAGDLPRPKRPTPPQASPAPTPPPPLRRRPLRAMALHVLDTSKALDEEDPHVMWLPVQRVNDMNDSNCGPEETILYTLVPGKGELIMFGGIRKDAASVAAHVSAGGAMQRGGRAAAPGGGGAGVGEFATGPGNSSANIANTVSNTLHFIMAPTNVI
ncbi:F-box only protein 42 [Ischnura elegans]|uniref:F-box only protein 42 n=1 Tax=Ischnura elegans TaxID=197161 RepID=UPI001ED87630|nr:F-box only protein 42 [Ischnura elegans]